MVYLIIKWLMQVLKCTSQLGVNNNVILYNTTEQYTEIKTL